LKCHPAAGPMNTWATLPSKDSKRLFVVGSKPRGELVQCDSKSRQFVPYLSGISADELAFSKDGEWVACVTFPEGVLWRSRTDGSERLQLSFPPPNKRPCRAGRRTGSELLSWPGCSASLGKSTSSPPKVAVYRFGLTPDDSPLVVRYVGTGEIYSLDWGDAP